jgi:hypothetical protein
MPMMAMVVCFPSVSFWENPVLFNLSSVIELPYSMKIEEIIHILPCTLRQKKSPDMENAGYYCNRGYVMKIDSTEFGSITIDGEIYLHDVLIRVSGKIRKRRKKLSKRQNGTSHIMSREEAEFVYENGCRLLIVGTGQNGSLRLSPEAAEFFARKGCKVIAEPTPDAITLFNEAKGKRIGLFHVTC